MEAMELLLNRRSCVVRDMIEPGPSPAELTTILQAGIRVPDHGKLFPWRIQVLDKAGQAELGEICATSFAEVNPEATADQIETERRRPSRAPVLLVVSSRIQDDHPKIPAIEQRLSGGALCQNLLNAVHAMGYVAQWLTEWPAFDDSVKTALGHSRDDDIIGFIYIGSAADPPNERRRASLEDVVTRWHAMGSETTFPGL